MNNLIVSEGRIVSLRYCIKNKDGDVLEDIISLPPINYLHGSTSIHKNLQAEVSGMSPGESRHISWKASELSELQHDIDIYVIIDSVREATLEELQQGNQALAAANIFCGDDCSCHTSL
jgi:hypothetical protein